MSALLQGAGSGGLVLPPLPAVGTEFARYDASTLGLADGASIASVANLVAGGAYPIEQSTSGNKPTFQASAFGGRGGILFDGTNDYLSTAVFSPAVGKVVTCFAVLQFTAAYGASDQAAVDTSNWHYMIRRTSSVNVSGYANAADHNTATTPQSAHIYTLRTTTVGGATYTGDFRVDSGSLSSAFTGFIGPLAPTRLVLGTQFEADAAAGNYAPVLVGEVLWYISSDTAGNPSVSDANATLVRAYLSAKWGTP